jgi:hypothetical protein
MWGASPYRAHPGLRLEATGCRHWASEFAVLPIAIALAATMDNNYVVKHKTLTKH